MNADRTDRVIYLELTIYKQNQCREFRGLSSVAYALPVILAEYLDLLHLLVLAP